MAKIDTTAENDDLVLEARRDPAALGRLYDLYYDRIFRFCLLRVYHRQAAEDITSMVFLTVAHKIYSFAGSTETDFRNWVYAIAANHANSYIRKTLRRKALFEKLPLPVARQSDCPEDLDWARLYKAISGLKPKDQTIVTLRFFENMDYEQIGKITSTRQGTVRVKLHRILEKLKGFLSAAQEGVNENV